MRAITLWQPMAWALASGIKPVENRPRRLPSTVLGETVAIHAGQVFSEEHWRFIEQLGFTMPDMPALLTKGAILGTCRFVKCGSKGDLAAAQESLAIYPDHMAQLQKIIQSPWFTGPFGYLVADVRRLAEPVPCKGALGFWTVPAHIEQLMEFSA